MVNIDTADDTFQLIDRNRDGVIDRNEFQSALRTGLPVTSYEAITTVPSYTGYATERYSSYASDSVINTSSREETQAYLERVAPGLCSESSAEIIRRGASDVPVTLEQRVLVRYLQPPPPPPPEPLIIQEVYDQPPPSLPPIRIREQPRAIVSQETPIIFRERPPILPPRRSGETITRVIPYPHTAGRSVIIDRFPTPPERPRDIVIERWLPYGPECERQTIVQRATSIPPPPRGGCKIFLYDAGVKRIVRKIEHLGVVQEDPNSYLARYGPTLCDSVTLLARVREAGVVEDISLRPGSPYVSPPVRRVGEPYTIQPYPNDAAARVILDTRRDFVTN